jgi:signal transduction histidine kinase
VAKAIALTLVDRWGWPLKGFHWVEAGWVVFALVNLVAMEVWATWETVPFHFIWVSLTILYGFRVWRMGPTIGLLSAIIVLTGAGLIVDIQRGLQPLDELTEVPLMSAMFFAMVWHARRRLSTMQRLQRVSDQNLRLLESSRQFLQDASHELGTPITVALGHAELIERQAADPTLRADAGVISDELLRLRRLVDRLLMLAASEHPDFLRKAPIDLEPIVVDAYRRWVATPRKWRLGEVEEAEVEADAERFAAALDAVIENAVKQTSIDGEIELSLRRRGADAIITVGDSGPGIHPGDLDRIFVRFARSDRGRSRRAGGMGLGLAIAKAVLDAHGGSVKASNASGGGAIFELILPLVQTVTAPQLPSNARAFPPAADGEAIPSPPRTPPRA